MIFIPESQDSTQDKKISPEDVSPHLWKNLRSANIKHKKQLYDIIAVKRASGKTGFKATYNNIDFTIKDIDEILEYLETSIDQE
jgi:hypothetical protein